MGYSISIKVKDKATGDKLIAFFKQNFRTWASLANEKAGKTLYQDEKESYFSALSWSKDLSYCHKKLHIGFDYNACMGEREYCFTLIRWLAIRFGDKINGTPRYLYDGCEWIEIDPKQYDANGMLLDTTKNYDNLDIKAEIGAFFEEIVGPEMVRLNTLLGNSL